MAATLQRKSSGGIIFVIITKIITKEIVPRNYFVIISARMVTPKCRFSYFGGIFLLFSGYFLGGEFGCRPGIFGLFGGL